MNLKGLFFPKFAIWLPIRHKRVMLLLRIKGKESEYKISDITSLATMIALNTMALEVVSKIPDITNLSTKAAFNTKAADIEKNNWCG